jgi:rhodanese-related sulfurtransferase
VKFLLDHWYLVLAALTSGGFLLWPAIAGAANASGISTAEAVRLINREKGVLIDISEPAEYAAAHASNSRNIPFGKLEGSKDLPSNKALPLLLLCPSGARAKRAVATLRKLGYAKAAAVSGGLKAWQEAQLPIERSAS